MHFLLYPAQVPVAENVNALSGAWKNQFRPLTISLHMHLRFKEILGRYLPPETIDHVCDFVVQFKIQLKITRNRNTKLGDYRPPGRIRAHRITINGNLNPWYFYLVFLHELAHLIVWVKYQNRVSPHGKQWKEEFASLLLHATSNSYFPGDMNDLVRSFAGKVKATFASDRKLWKYLNENVNGETQVLEDLPSNAYFIATNGKIFRKEARLRTRYRCYCLNNKRRYLFHPFASIKPVDKDDLPVDSII